MTLTTLATFRLSDLLSALFAKIAVDILIVLLSLAASAAPGKSGAFMRKMIICQEGTQKETAKNNCCNDNDAD